MNDSRYNDEIEVLDGLDDILEEEQPKEEIVEVQPTSEPEEVLSVLDEQPSDSNTEKPEESPITRCVPDSLGDFSTTENESLMKEKTEPEVETPTVTETPKMEEIFHFDFEEPAAAQQETKDPEPILPEVEPVMESEVKPMEEVEEVMPVEEKEVEMPKEEDPVLASFDSVLEPIDIVDTKEPEKEEEKPSLVVEEPKLEVSEENTDLEKTDYNINYDFSDVFANNTENSTNQQPTIDDAFQFEPSLTALTPEPTNSEVPFPDTTAKEEDLGKTVIIEPVEPKPISEEPVESEVKEEIEPKNEPVINKEEKNSEVKEEKKKAKKEKKKMDGRMIVFVVLIILLLLAFVILLPTILENFAI